MDREEPDDVQRKPEFDTEAAAQIALTSFGISGELTSLPSERDLNFKIATDHDGAYVLKISNPSTSLEIVELENQAIQLAGASDRFSELKLFRNSDRQLISQIIDANHRLCMVRMLRYVEGQPLAKLPNPSSTLLRELGAALAELDQLLNPLSRCNAAKRELKWDLANARDWLDYGIEHNSDPHQKQQLGRVLERYLNVEGRLQSLPRSVIHNDANDYNVIVDGERVCFIDFGDIVFSQTIYNLAICAAYVSMGSEQPLVKISSLVAGYDAVRSLEELEMSVLFPLILARLGQSVSIGAQQLSLDPGNEYLAVSQAPAWSALEKLIEVEPELARIRFSDACLARYSESTRAESDLAVGETGESLLTRRRRLLGPSLSLSYDRPLQIVRGRGQYLFDQNGAAFLDCVNNVCHVGHCHPDVVEAATGQIKTLNTNTRYLHENIVKFADRLTATLPNGLDVCFFANSGSEANELALRMARSYTGQRDVAVIDHAYHGHTTALIELSPYKFDGRGGWGKPEHVHVLAAPDGYRGEFKNSDANCGVRFAEQARTVLETALKSGDRTLAAFFAESLLGCGGQVPLPKDYLKKMYDTVRGLGGVCIADEVQVGFGRVGTHFWGFEQQGVVPDIVTMGKPIGNGHPLAAVVTTREIADAFDNGMEYFNTFGGNPVSCAVGMAVLDVIEKENLQLHALEVGGMLIDSFRELMDRHPIIGDVRGSGLFLGLELVRDRETLEPAAEEADAVVQRMRSHHILLSTDGPFHNVIKLKPPMVFDQADAERLVLFLDRTLAEIAN